MITDTEAMAYIGRRNCGCVVAVSVDTPFYRRDVAKDLAEFIRRGYTVERVTVEQAKQMLQPHCEHT